MDGARDKDRVTGAGRQDTDGLRGEVAALEQDKATLEALLERERAETASVSDAVDALEGAPLPAPAKKQVIWILSLLLFFAVGYFGVRGKLRHSELSVCSSAGTDAAVVGKELTRLLGLMDLDGEVEGYPRGRCVKATFKQVVPPGRRGRLTRRLQRLQALKPTPRGSPPRFSLVVTEQDKKVLAAIEREPKDPRIIPLKLRLDDGELWWKFERKGTHSFNQDSLLRCYWSIPSSAALPGLVYKLVRRSESSDGVSLVSPKPSQNLWTVEPGGLDRTADHRVDASAPGLEAVTAMMTVIINNASKQESFVTMPVAELNGFRNQSSKEYKKGICSSRLMARLDPVPGLASAILFPTLSRKLERFDLDDRWW